jgi:hypothetical protein
MKLEVADYIKLKNGGAVMVLEMDEEAREGLISEAIKRRVIEGLERMPDVPEKEIQLDIEDYIAGVEAGERMDSVESASQPSGVHGVEEDS